MSGNGDGRRVGRPPGADAERTRAEILDAALDAFAERGFEGASIREITGAVGVGHNLVRHYFGTKEDLWRAAVKHGLGPVSARIAGLLRDDRAAPPDDALRTALAILLAEGGANPSALRLLITEAIRGGPRFDEMYDDVIAPVADVVMEYVAAVGDDLTVADPRLIGLFVFGAVFSPFSFEGLTARLGIQAPKPDRPLDEHAQQLIDLIMTGLLRN